jgi:drug/metabolite transporter (DMT)-like permease
MALSAFGFSIMSVLVKVTSARLPTGEITFFRAATTLVISYFIVRRAGIHPWGNHKPRLILRGLIGFCGLTTYYIALSRLPLSDATTLQNTAPLFTAVIAWALLGERVGWRTALALALGIGGVLLVVHPTAGGIDPIGAAIALVGACCSAFAYVTVRTLSKTENPLVIVLYFPLVATPLALPWALSSFVMPTLRDAGLLLGLSCATQIAQVYLTKGLSILRAGRATSIGYLQVAFAMGWQYLVFGKPPTLASLFGAALIVAGTLAVAK